MRSCLPGLVVVALGGWCAVAPARGQAGDPPPAVAPTTTTDPAPPPPSPDVTTPPPADQFVVIPLRVHVLSATDLPEIQCALLDDDIHRIVGKVNGIWHKAGIHWALDPIVREPAANQDRFKIAREHGPDDALPLFKILAPAESKASEGMNVYYIHAFAVNGVFLGDRTAFVQETAQLRPVPGGIDEPLPRVTAHELGHALGLPHRQNRTNLLASGTTGTILNQAEVDRVRGRITRMPGSRTVPELRRQLDEAKAQTNAPEVARLAAILAAIPPNPPPRSQATHHEATPPTR